jgi:hypothetical protein
MTEEMMKLRALLEKAPDANILREKIGLAARRSWSWKWLSLAALPAAGAVELRIAKLRKGGLLPRLPRTASDFAAVIGGAWKRRNILLHSLRCGRPI